MASEKDEKMKDSKMTKKSKKEALTPLGPEEPGPGEGVGTGGLDGLVTGHTRMQHPRKKSSVLGCFRDTFVMCDIFGSKKILRPALVLNSTIHTLPPRPLKILAH